jgi:hypothetical protein
MRLRLLTTLMFLSLFMLTSGQALAQVVDCTSIASVNLSHFVANNNEYGGHLNAHVSGQTPPAGYTQKDKTLFTSTDDWEESYNLLSTQQNPLQCNSGAALGTEAARTLSLQFFSEQCTNANGAGRCTASRSIQTNKVYIVLRVVPDGSRKRWIVYTAYPVQ